MGNLRRLLLVMAPVAALASCFQPAPDNHYVSPDSPYAHGLYQRQVPAEPIRLYGTHAALQLIGAREDAQVLGRFIERATLLKIINEPMAIQGTVQDVIAQESARTESLEELRARVLAQAIEAEIVEQLPDTPFVKRIQRQDEGHYVEKSLWQSRAYPDRLRLRFAVTNRTSEIMREFAGFIEFVPAASESVLRLFCNGFAENYRDGIQPGKTDPATCDLNVEKRSNGVTEVVTLVREAKRGRVSLRMDPHIIKFLPRGHVGRHDISVDGQFQARQSAYAEIEAAGCRERGNCFHSLVRHANLVLFVTGLVLGALVSTVFAFRKRQLPVKAAILFSVVPVSILAVVVLSGCASDGYGGLFILYYSLIAAHGVGGFLLGLWTTTAAVSAFRGDGT